MSFLDSFVWMVTYLKNKFIWNSKLVFFGQRALPLASSGAHIALFLDDLGTTRQAHGLWISIFVNDAE